MILPDPANLRNLLWQLPIPDYGNRLFGVDRQVEQLSGWMQSYPPWILAIHGIGGVGKTALVNYTLRQVFDRVLPFDQVVWISAKQQRLTGSGIVGSRSHVNLDQIFDSIGDALGLEELVRLPRSQKVSRLTAYLRGVPCLVVIDNLETVNDYEEIVPYLERMADPSKFVLTSRETVPALTTVTEISVDELEESPSLELVRSVVQRIRDEGRTVPSFSPQHVYTLVGGNPLAIILIVSQMQFYSPDVVLSQVREGDLDSVYRYIYWRSWSLLSDDARDVLHAIRRANDEADLEWLEISTQMSRQRLVSALGQLRTLSLVRPLNVADRFAIHRFTSTFLRIEVFKWA